ncbi:MAG: hypothetical protein CVU88_07515 [Firmicutes bacterium HGW-Firmicutes-13]|nr:MAG: hypothetical protein CVU88_07515 [Firmicutes bacterium HGW-Firmicutes-13]
MNTLAYKYLGIPKTKKKKYSDFAPGLKDIFVAGVINQKTVNQTAQQTLIAIAAQVLKIIEAQFGFAANDDSDTIKA